jgi:predicted adenylyl cyclase CyaB
MAKEIEAKFRVESHEPVRQALLRAGATMHSRVRETNRIFDRRDGSLRAAGCGLRIRNTIDANGRQAATLTFKGPVEPGPFKSREEIEVTVGDATNAKVLLEGLGFVEILAYEKDRESWALGECRVELDKPARIGLFVEIEGPYEASIARVRDVLGLSDVAQEGASYVRMMLEYRRIHSLPNELIRLEKSLE